MSTSQLLLILLTVLSTFSRAETFADVRLRIASNKWTEVDAYLKGHPAAPDELAAINSGLEALQEMKRLDEMADLLLRRYELMVAEASPNLDHLFNRTLIPLVQHRIVQRKRPEALALIARARKDFTGRPQAAAVEGVLKQLEELAKPPEIGDRMVPFAFPDLLTSAPVDSSKFKDKVLLLEFWVTTCDICARQKETLRKVIPLYKDKGLEVIGFAQDENIEALKAFVQKEKIDWLQCADSNPMHRFAEKMKVDFIPTNILVDSSGVILGVNLRGEDLEKALAGLFTAP
ncbi:MAG: TlpA disulfide reductase family protein [Kiritimatiellia bacterium]